MPTTLRNGDILFNNGTTQDSAAATISSSTALDGIGSYAVLTIAVNTNLAMGSTIAGSSLRYNNPLNNNLNVPPPTNNPFVRTYTRSGTGYNSYNGGGSAVSGTWRKMSQGDVYFNDTYNGSAYWGTALYVRIS
jgi:hypothetical protein